MVLRNLATATALRARTVSSVLIGAGAATALMMGTAAPAAATGQTAPVAVTAAPTMNGSCDVNYFGYNQTQVQVHNCPGNGAGSWAWIWSPYQAGKELARVDLSFTQGSGDSLYSTVGSSSSRTFSHDITSVVICERWGQNEYCSNRLNVH
ncbi:hypothetical protein [Streptomyces cadmiisoli]|uniref:hypothetical protein n=1 Tax=Streptomyces cadmiisoli TaxID=2184053 RepID=UPI003D73B0DB